MKNIRLTAFSNGSFVGPCGIIKGLTNRFRFILCNLAARLNDFDILDGYFTTVETCKTLDVLVGPIDQKSTNTIASHLQNTSLKAFPRMTYDEAVAIIKGEKTVNGKRSIVKFLNVLTPNPNSNSAESS